MDLNALFSMTYGLFVVSSFEENKLNGQMSNAVFQIKSKPPTIQVVINKQNLTHSFIESSGYFGVSILNTDTPLKYIGHFGFKSGRDIEKFSNDIKYKIGTSGVPLPTDYTIAILECKLVNKIDIDTHTIFIGELIESEVIGEGEPLTYTYYHKIKRGTEPKTAPTYIKKHR